MEKRPIRETLRRFATDYPEEFDRFALAIAVFEGWECQTSRDHARSELLRRLRPKQADRRRDNFDGDWVLIAEDFFPDDAIVQMHQRRASVAQIRREEKQAELRVVEAERGRSAA
jgi:hypothetical protein